MLKITFVGAGSTIFARNVLGDVMCSPILQQCEIALYDIDPTRLEESYRILSTINRNINEGRAQLKTYLGVDNRQEALRDATFVVNAIQVGGYEPCTVIDFEVPKKYGLRQTIGDTLGIGGKLDLNSVNTVGLNQFDREYYGYLPRMGTWYICDKDGNDLYPEIKKRAKEKNATEKASA